MTSRLLETTARCLARYESHWIPGPILVAMSGGRDSTALAWVLAHLRDTGRLDARLVAAHVNHGVHDQSDAAADVVRETCATLGLELCEETLATQSPAAANPSEETLRDARYRAFEHMARATGARTILLAHHADDDVETVLFRMMRGTGPRGLAGIPEFRRVSEDLNVLRPVLKCRARELHEVVSREHLPWFEDPTNRDLSYSRNRLRHEILPAMRARSSSGAAGEIGGATSLATGPDSIDEALATLARAARKVTDILDAQAVRFLGDHARFRTPWRCEVDIDDPTQSHRGSDAVPHRVFLEEAICQIHERVHPTGRRPRWNFVQRVTELLELPSGHRVHGYKELLVERTGRGLLFLDTTAAGEPPESAPVLPESGAARFGTTEWMVSSEPRTEPPLSPSPGFPGEPDQDVRPGVGDGRVTAHVILDPRQAARPWRLRTRRAGDRFWTLGGTEPVDLRRFMKNRRVPRFDRDRLPLLVDADDRVLWVPGVEIGDPYRVRLETENCYELKLSIVGGELRDPTPY